VEGKRSEEKACFVLAMGGSKRSAGSTGCLTNQLTKTNLKKTNVKG